MKRIMKLLLVVMLIISVCLLITKNNKTEPKDTAIKDTSFINEIIEHLVKNSSRGKINILFLDEFGFHIRDSLLSSSDSLILQDLIPGYKNLRAYNTMCGLPEESILSDYYFYEFCGDYALFGIGNFGWFDKKKFKKNTTSFMYRKKGTLIMKLKFKKIKVK